MLCHKNNFKNKSVANFPLLYRGSEVESSNILQIANYINHRAAYEY